MHIVSFFSSPGLLCCLFFFWDLTKFLLCPDCTAFYKIRGGEWLKLMSFINTDRDRLEEYEFISRDELLGSLEMTLEMVECNLYSVILLKVTA